MNQYDLDRALREWLEPGAERARDGLVWDVIDQVEGVPQRRRWHTDLQSGLDRLSPFLRPLGVAAVMVLAVVIVAALAARNVGEPDPTPPAFTTPDLDAILVWEDTRPSSWHLDNLVSNPSAVLAIPARSMSDDAWLAQPAFRTLVGGRYTDFTGEDAVFMSWGTIYATVGGARDAYAQIARELGGDDGWGLGTGEPTGFGDQGEVFTGETRVPFGREPGDPVAARLHLWRAGNAVLAIGGWFDYDEAELDAVARAMEGRAAQVDAGR